MAEAAIEVRGLSKTYPAGTRGGYQTLREALTRALIKRDAGRGETTEATVRALRKVDLTIEQGEAIGIVGRNGAGKTTLLKILARITEPTSGVARMRGRAGALLDVGTGFHPELTGRENIYLNGVVLGMSRREVAQQFDSITEFAGVERFLDLPIKRYSHGMKLRLAFAVAAHLTSEIVLVDEVLAAGDEEFQRRCLGKMADFGNIGRTVVFVSHDLGAVTRLCARAVWLDNGSVAREGPATEVVDAYLGAGALAASAEYPVDRSMPVQLARIAVTDSAGEVLTSPRRDAELWIRLRIRVHQTIPGLDFSFTLVNRRGVRVLCDNWSDTRSSAASIDEPGEYEAIATVPPMLPAGEYVLVVWIGTAHVDLFQREVLRLRLQPRRGERTEELERPRAAAPLIAWEVARRAGRS